MNATSSRAVRANTAPAGLAVKDSSCPAGGFAAAAVAAAAVVVGAAAVAAVVAVAALLAVPGSAVAAATPAASAAPAAPAATAAAGKTAPADFSGRWTFVPAKSANIGMMASLEIHAAVEQGPAALTVHEDSIFQGQKSARDLRYDLGGKPVPNRGPMGDPSETVSRWEGSRLVTVWTSQGAVAGTKVVRTETRLLSADGKTMTLESVRGSAAPLVMVFERE